MLGAAPFMASYPYRWQHLPAQLNRNSGLSFPDPKKYGTRLDAALEGGWLDLIDHQI
jgi:hypothetical protein